MARIYRATFMTTYGSTLVEPSLHYQTDLDVGGDEPSPNDIADAIWTELGGAYLAICSPSMHTDALVVSEEVVKPAIGVAGVHSVNTSGTYTGSGATAADGINAIINIHTGTRSRSARGWFHAPPPQYEERLQGNGWASAYKTRLDTFAALLDNVMELGTIVVTRLRPVVYSRTRHRLNEEPWTFDVNNATVNVTQHWLRSRMSSP